MRAHEVNLRMQQPKTAEVFDNGRERTSGRLGGPRRQGQEALAGRGPRADRRPPDPCPRPRRHGSPMRPARGHRGFVRTGRALGRTYGRPVSRRASPSSIPDSVRTWIARASAGASWARRRLESNATGRSSTRPTSFLDERRERRSDAGQERAGGFPGRRPGRLAPPSVTSRWVVRNVYRLRESLPRARTAWSPVHSGPKRFGDQSFVRDLLPGRGAHGRTG